MKKYIYLKFNNTSVFLKHIKSANIKQYYVFEKDNFILRILNKIGSINELFFGNWKYDIKQYDYVILGENYYSSNIAKYIKKKNPNCKIIMYYWNIINNKAYKKILQDKNIDVFWSFDKEDSRKYNLKYNPQFYSKEVILRENKIENDVLFLGMAKNRKEQLMKLDDRLTKNKIKTNFIIVENKSQIISYDDYLELISKAKCILDYNQEGQIGLTLRPLEALFLEKKLITNNKDIVNYDFYNPNNIFVLGVDDMNKIKEFIERPYEKIDPKIVEYYDFEQWIKRFDI